MRLFRNRFDDEYQQHLLRQLSISRLLETSIPISRPRVRGGAQYDRCCRIDFMGLAATTLLDIACNFVTSDQVPKKFVELVNDVSQLNDQGIFAKVRFLFVYPYATSFFSLIQAESSVHRASVDSPAYLRDFAMIDEVNDETFFGSATVQNLKNGLDHLQELIEASGWNEEDSPNTIRVRFTPVDVNSCVLIINNELFYDPYLFAKAKRRSKSLSLMAPVVGLNETQDKDAFRHFEDHFRYLWDLDTTLVCEDATGYKAGVHQTLQRILPPTQITFDHKARRIKELQIEQTQTHSPESEIQGWKFRVRHALGRFSTNTKPAPTVESAFVGCSWRVESDGKSRPNAYARQLLDWLEHDFGSKREVPLMSIHVLEAATGDSLARQVYARLREATLAIIILSADIKLENGIYLTKPNVIHELGYLMRHLEDSRRLMVLKEQGVEVPTNIGDNVYVDFHPSKLAMCYRDILHWLTENDVVTDNGEIIQAFRSHSHRLREMIVGEEVTQQEGIAAIEKIELDVSDLNAAKTPAEALPQHAPDDESHSQRRGLP